MDLDLRGCPAAPVAVLQAPASSRNLEILEFCPFGIRLEKRRGSTAWDMTGQKFQGLGLKLKPLILTFQDLEFHICQVIMRVAGC